MIYWPYDTDEVRWSFPNNFQITGDDLPDGFYLEARNDVGLFVLDGDLYDPEVSPGYIVFTLQQTPEDEDGIFPPGGEYTYRLYTYKDLGLFGEPRTQLISEGLMIAGSYEGAYKEYDNEVEEYEQYTEH